jgi:hypothetical protein
VSASEAPAPAVISRNLRRSIMRGPVMEKSPAQMAPRR